MKAAVVETTRTESRGYRAIFLASRLALFLLVAAFIAALCCFCRQPLWRLSDNERAQLAFSEYNQLLSSTAKSDWFWSIAGKVPAETVVAQSYLYDSFVVVVYGDGIPERRKNEEQFLSVEPDLPIPTDVINSAVWQLERVLGRNLFPFKVVSATFARQGALKWRRPVAVYDASSGRVLLDSLVVEMLSYPGSQYVLTSIPGAFCEQLARAMQQFATSDIEGALLAPSLVNLLATLASAAGVAITVVFSAAPPLWFCLTCPVVLGLAAPLLINFGLGALAGELCNVLHLSDDQCFDFWLGALGLGFVLSLASAVPIFMVCRLYECEHRNDTTVIKRF